MASLAHRSMQRRSERAPMTAHGGINLVPLVDILTSIVFFSLLTYQGEMAALTSYDLSLPPAVITAEGQQKQGSPPPLNLLLAVKLTPTGDLQVEHSEQGGFKQLIRGQDSTAMDQLQALLTQIHQQYPQNNDVLVVPNDNSSYDTVVHVLERARLAQYQNISLGSRARDQNVASAGGA